MGEGEGIARGGVRRVADGENRYVTNGINGYETCFVKQGGEHVALMHEKTAHEKTAHETTGL